MKMTSDSLTRPESAPLVDDFGAASGSVLSKMVAPMRRLVSSRKGKAAAAGLAVYVVIGLGWRLLPLPAPDYIDQTVRLRGPSAGHLLGTDEFGRDILSRIFDGIGITLGVSAISISVALVIGVSTGIFAAYSGGWVDAVLMRAYDALLAMPDMILAIAVAAIIGTGARDAIVALAVVGTPQFARIVRSSCLSELPKTYIEASVSLGGSRARIMFRHLLPNSVGPIAVQTAIFGAFSVLMLAGLSFLGLGVQPPAPSLGGMLSTARQYLATAPWYAVGPGLAIALLVLTLNALADCVRDITDRRGR